MQFGPVGNQHVIYYVIPFVVTTLDHLTFKQRVVEQNIIELQGYYNHTRQIIALLNFFVDENTILNQVVFHEIQKIRVSIAPQAHHMGICIENFGTLFNIIFVKMFVNNFNFI
jgi:hypothetical protein